MYTNESGILLALLAACGCGAPAARASPPTPPAAPSEERLCADADAWGRELRALSRAALLGVEPRYFVDTCSGTTKVSGTRLTLRAPVSGASEGLARLLRCSSTRVRLRDDAAWQPGAGLWLPEGWMDIDVEAKSGGFAVTLSAESVAKNVALWHRAGAVVGGL